MLKHRIIAIIIILPATLVADIGLASDIESGRRRLCV